MHDFFAPHLNWLQNRWALPEQCLPLALGILKAEAEGSTAFPIDGTPPELGTAGVQLKLGDKPPEQPVPIVLLQNGESAWAQSWLYYKAEHEIASLVAARIAADASDGARRSRLRPVQPAWPSAKAKQLQALQMALDQSFVLLTGGPGTGKTLTLVRILGALLEAMESPRVILTAPTGKAADQMKTSVSRNIADLPEPQRVPLQQIADQSRTLHKTLGYNPETGTCKYNAQNPLPCDLLVLDEASMCDVLLFRALLKALPSEARLIIVGDPNQLPSVEPGNVLGELARVAAIDGSVLAPVWVHLTERVRFNEDAKAIADLATAFEERSPEMVAQVLTASTTSNAGLTWIKRDSARPLRFDEFPEPIQQALTEVAQARDPQHALALISRICILSPFRVNFSGAEKFNERIEEHFARLLPEVAHTQPVIINRNDPETGLKNGTVGVIVTDPVTGERAAWFHQADGIRKVPIAKLLDYSPAWVLTVHRSQGSEYEQVMVIMPNEESQMNSRELIYTAITRAKSAVYIVGSLEAVQKAAQSSPQRVTMTGQQLLALHPF